MQRTSVAQAYVKTRIYSFGVQTRNQNGGQILAVAVYTGKSGDD